MEQEKNKSGVVALVIVLCLFVLGLGGYIVYDKVLQGDDQTTNNVDSTAKSKVVDKAVLNILNDLVGLPNGEGEDMCLNYYVSNNDYNQYAKQIMTYYGNRNTGSHRYFLDATYNETFACNGAADCDMITKSDANKLVKLYNFSGTADDYFTKVDNEYWYKFAAYYNMHGPCLTDLKITHNATSEYVGDTDVKITDTQVLTYNDNGAKTVNKTVEYNFKTDENGNYYLNNVIVK